MSGQRVTYAGAAEILGCHVSYVPKLIAKGLLQSDRRHPGGSLDLHQVEQLAAIRAEAARQRRLRAQLPPRRTPPRDPRPDHEHEWVSAERAGRVLGISAQAVTKRARKGTIPHTRANGRVWVRADHLALVANAKRAPEVEASPAGVPDG